MHKLLLPDGRAVNREYIRYLLVLCLVLYVALFCFFYYAGPWGGAFGFAWLTTHDGQEYFRVGLDPHSRIRLSGEVRYMRIGLPLLANVFGRCSADVETFLHGRSYCNIPGMKETFPLYLWWMSIYLFMFNLLGMLGSLYEWHRFAVCRWGTKTALVSSGIWIFHPVLFISIFSTLTTPLEVWLAFLFLRKWRENSGIHIQVLIATVGMFIKESMALLLIARGIYELYTMKQGKISRGLINLSVMSLGGMVYLGYMAWASYYDPREYNILGSYVQFGDAALGVPFWGHIQSFYFQLGRIAESNSRVSFLGIVLRFILQCFWLMVFCYGLWSERKGLAPPEWIYGLLVAILGICSKLHVAKDFDNAGRVLATSLVGYVCMVSLCRKNVILRGLIIGLTLVVTLNYAWYVYKLKIYGDYSGSRFPYSAANRGPAWWEHFKINAPENADERSSAEPLQETEAPPR